jgi:hypothetical protein
MSGETGTTGADAGLEVGVPATAGFGKVNPSSDTSTEGAGDRGGLAKAAVEGSGEARGIGILEREPEPVGEVNPRGE